MFPTFANPQWLWCLFLLLPLAGLRVWSHWRSRQGTRGLVSPRLAKELVVGAKQWSRWVVFSLQLLALASLLITMARPQWGYEITDTESESRNVIIAIDTSRSMLANDLTPDRITRAKLAAQDIVQSLPEDRIGLIAFAGKAFLQAPLTLDHDAVVESIQQFDTELIPRGGSNLTDAAKLAVEIFDKASSQESALIIFSDGEALEGRDELDSIVEDAKNVGLMVVSIGVGTQSGSIIPEPDEKGRPQPGVFVTDEEGKVVRTRLDPTALQELSGTIGGGVYLDLAATASVSKTVPDALRRIEATRGVSEARRRPIERFVWPLSTALFLIVAAWMLPGTTRWFQRVLASRPSRLETTKSPDSQPDRKTPPSLPASKGTSSASRVAALALPLFALNIGPAVAEVGEVESQAFETYKKQDFEQAIEAYRTEIEIAEPGKQRAWLNLGLGAAAYKSGDLALAKEAFGRTLIEGDDALSTRAHYNLANTLFRAGEKALEENAHPKVPTIAKDDDAKAMIAEQWQSAREHYEAALAVDSGNRDAQYNLGVLQQRLQLLNQPPPPEEEQEDEEKDDNEDQNQNQQDQQNQNSSSDSDPKPGEQPPSDQQEQEQNPQGEKPEDQNPSEPQDPSETPAKPEPSDQPPPPDPEGELDGKPKEPQEQEAQPQPAQETEVNPETGFSPEEARQMLRALADEDADARPPIRMPMQAEKYKNW